MKYSLWAVPPQPIFDELTEVIRVLAVKYKGPVFQPHLTILGGIEKDLNEIIKSATKIAEHTPALDLSLGPVSFSTTYYQSVFLRVDATAQLMQLNLDIKKALNGENNVFMPHISLMYGNHEMAVREKIANSIQFPNISFLVSTLVIILEGPGPTEWQPVETISLQV